MHEERLRRLNDFLPKAEAYADDCRAVANDAEALVRDTREAIAKETKERRHLRGLPLLFPAALAATGAAWRWAGRNSAGVAAFGAGATVAAAAAVGITQIADDPPADRRIVTAPAPTTTSAPPAGRTPTPTKPPKGSQPTAPPSTTPTPTPTPTPGPPSQGTPPPADSVAPRPHTPPKTHKPPNPHKPPTPPGKPANPSADDPTVTTEDCRINLLGIQLLCGHLVSSDQLPSGWPLS